MPSDTKLPISSLRTGFINITSLRGHILDFREFIGEDTNLDVIGIAETWLDTSIPDNIIEISGFNIFRNDRNSRGGGVALYIRNSFKVTIIASSNTSGPDKPGKPEHLMCSIQQGKHEPVFICVVYKPPNISTVHNCSLKQDILTFSSTFSHKVIIGDFNCNILGTGSEARFVPDLADELSLQLVQHGPTHFSNTTRTWIDAMLVDSNDTIKELANRATSFHSRHNFIEVNIEIPILRTVKEDLKYRNYKGVNNTELINLLSDYDWTLFEVPDMDPVHGLECLNNNLSQAIDKLAPEKVLRMRRNNFPWMNDHIKMLQRKTEATYKRHRRTQDPELYKQFVELRRNTEEETDRARTKYLRNKINEARKSNAVWKELHNIGLLPKPKGDLNGFTPQELNDHFAKVSISQNENADTLKDIVSNAPEEGFAFSKISLKDVKEAVAHFSSEAVGEDGIPHSIISKALPFIGPHVVQIFNASLKQGIFPDTWKKAHVIPLKKARAPSSPADFRPISILPLLSKVFEKIVHSQMIQYLESNNLIDPLQTGFRKNHSTQTALLKLADDIRTGMDSKLLTVLLLFDMSKAFDSISRTRLLRKLQELGFSKTVLAWICSYLTGREQLVTSRSEGNSSWLTTNLGVPQGSVLGPLLFILYINDICKALPTDKVKHLLYADDLQIYIQISRDKLHEGVNLLAEAARSIQEWANAAGLRLNVAKTKAILFGPSKTVSEIMLSDLEGVKLYDGTFIPFSSSVTSLGVVLDSSLSWKDHINSIGKKINKVMYCLRHFRRFTDENLRKKLVEALAFPHIDYCSVVYSDASLQLRTRIQVMQNSCIRYIHGLKGTDRVTPHRVKLAWMRTDTRRFYFLGLALYKILREKTPSYLSEFFENYISHGPTRRNKPELKIPFARTEIGIQAFKVSGARFWNSLPTFIRDSPSLGQFKTSLWRHLFALD